ncbi:MAG: hypothetical protein HRJ53_07660 [Acidobacteria bacterium Pan2503]|uniref:Uncharacterized protein n=1 Tax=Candidatus Acidiferrum panamense TaxID=2741543 RepID=A0A7V8SW28_9BACT|nr:hypothetical protein [Candidatus Acidoferrum panamensis]
MASIRRAALKNRQERGVACNATLIIDQVPDVMGLNFHECTLQRGHWGLCVCWCEMAFNSDGQTFERRPLPGFPERGITGVSRHMWGARGSQ